MKKFNHKRPVRDAEGEIIGHKPAPATRETNHPLGGAFGPDKHRPLVVQLADGDIIQAWPKGTRQRKSITTSDLWRYLCRCESNRKLLDRANQAKARKKLARLHRAEKRIQNQWKEKP